MGGRNYRVRGLLEVMAMFITVMVSQYSSSSLSAVLLFVVSVT